MGSKFQNSFFSKSSHVAHQIKGKHHESKYSIITHILDLWGGIKRSIFFDQHASKNVDPTCAPDLLGWVEISDIEIM